MKTFYTFILSLILLSFSNICSAQMPAAVKEPSIPITWLGLDFEKALIIGDASLDMASFKGMYAKKINDIIVNDPKRYDLKKYLLKNQVSYETTMIDESNGEIFEDNFVPAAPDLKSFTKEDIESLVKDYSLNANEGIGVVMIVRSMNKTKAKFTANLTYIDLSSKETVYTQEFTVAAGGVEWAAYWANAVRRVLIEAQVAIKK